jgi:hypothetical protein
MRDLIGLEPMNPKVLPTEVTRIYGTRGSPEGNRTPIFSLKERCPKPLDDGTKREPGGTRTPNPLGRNQALCSIELRVHGDE